MSLRIREAAETDLDSIIDLIEHDSITGKPRAREEYIWSFREIAAHPDNHIIVGELDSRIVAVLQLTFIPGLTQPWRAQAENVRVREDVRNTGIGTQMIDSVIAQARNRGCTLVQLTTNLARIDAQRFYERLGFKASHAGMKLYL